MSACTVKDLMEFLSKLDPNIEIQVVVAAESGWHPYPKTMDLEVPEIVEYDHGDPFVCGNTYDLLGNPNDPTSILILGSDS